MAEFKYEITQELGVISEGKYNIELNMVSWNDREPKYDIRSWAPDTAEWARAFRSQKKKWSVLLSCGTQETKRTALKNNIREE